jgi:LPXTG-motif cell wall-anchored protein
VNLFKSKLRRTTAVLAGAFIGMAGAVALAAPASAHSPTVTGSTTCVDKDGNWSIDWSFGNDYGTPATVKKIKLVPKRVELTGDITKDGQEIPARSAGNPDAQIHGTTAVTGKKIDEVSILVWLKWSDYETKWNEPAHYTVKKPDACKPDTPPVEETPTAPTPIAQADCDTLTLGLDNTQKGAKDITLTFKTSKGESRELEVKAGEKETTKFSAKEGFSVEVGAKGVKETTTVKYEQPANCSPGSGGGDNGGGLPVTGAAASSIAGGAAVLLIAGAVMFFVARRRKVKFTA